ncbi:signal peptidase I [Nakamurella panacisegetis]|uniref:Signal peptidase I n=1 Tax=Nakamurella panacisegetis TaxID=1090615 RepID=A0A1H0LWS5_9ACTN|nr:signal peptidase I [Nakamurella panacisegetis]SDO72533.1 signal peptidase I [Nakamurella panacisegetis]
MSPMVVGAGRPKRFAGRGAAHFGAGKVPVRGLHARLGRLPRMAEPAREIDEPDEPEDGGSDPVPRGARRTAGRRKRSLWKELPILVVVAFALTFVIQTFVAKVYYVPSGSMEKTIHGALVGGDRILANKVVYDFRDPEQGDVVVFKGPDTWAPETGVSAPSGWFRKSMAALGSVVGVAPPDEKDFVKRVIAVGGQTVQCCDTKGNVEVDGRSLNEPYIYSSDPENSALAFRPGVRDCTTGGTDTTYGSRRCFAPVKVPAGQLWVMGDHRDDSDDSSYNCLGYKSSAPQAAGCSRPIPVDNVIGKAVLKLLPVADFGTIGNPDIDPTASASGPTAAVPTTGGVLLALGLRGGIVLTPARRRRRRLLGPRVPRPSTGTIFTLK